MKPFESLRFLEIGETPYVKLVFPEQTDFFSTSPRRPRGTGEDAGAPIEMSNLRRKLEPNAVDLILLRSETYAPWHPFAQFRMMFTRRNFGAVARPFRRADDAG